jgi:hypothetical protein
MPRCWRLLFALALVAIISATIFPPPVEADSLGIFNDGVGIVDLDDDFDEVLRRLRPEVYAHTPATILEVAPPRLLHHSHNVVGSDPGNWTGRLHADRGPPARCQLDSTSLDAPACKTPAGRFDSFPKQLASDPSKTDVSRSTHLPAVTHSHLSLAHHLSLDHALRTERTPWPL